MLDDQLVDENGENEEKENVIFSRWILLVPLLLDLTQLFLFAPRS